VKVVAVGEGHLLTDGTIKELEIKVGDNVVFSKMTGTVIYIDNDEHLILKERDILGIIN
jgi:chaperonin GroES